jgi:hypothetical protein
MSYYQLGSDEFDKMLTKEKRDKDSHYRAVLINKINQIIKDNNLIKLKNDYLGMSGFYYHRESNKIYEVNYVEDRLNPEKDPVFKISDDKHIRELNRL